jgi:Na+/melibiose symporter-like transporter
LVYYQERVFLKPWVRISVVAIPLSTILLFASPADLPLSFKVIWVSIGYILWDRAYTICDVPIFGLVTTLTNRIDERNFLLSLTRIFSGVGAAAVIIVIPVDQAGCRRLAALRRPLLHCRPPADDTGLPLS